jgi:BclB C-terminal domain-containing protein
VSDVGGTIAESFSPGGPNLPSEVIPRAETITGISFQGSSTTVLSLIGTTLTVTAQLYEAAPNTTVFSAVAGASCTAAPALTGILITGTQFNCLTSGLSIPVPAQEQLIEVVSLTATGLTLVNTLGLNAAVGLTGS